MDPIKQLRPGSYVVVKGLVPDCVCELVHRYTKLKHETGQLMAADWRIPGAERAYADALTEALLEEFRGRIETVVGEALLPTYSYLRIHQTGHAMARHTDRDACEVGVTIAMGGDDWPIWIQPAETPMRVSLEKGDAMIYSGRESPHWRDPFEGREQVQVMLFYVRAEGPFACHRFDGRAALGLPFKPPAVDTKSVREVPTER